MARDRLEVRMDTKVFRQKIGTIQLLFDKRGDKVIKRVLRKGAKPWPDAINDGKMYKHIKKQTGLSNDPIGLQTFHSTTRGEIGVKARPKSPRSKAAGWRAHFFATPAKHIRAIKKVPFNSYYKAKNGEVIGNVFKGVRTLIRTTFLRPRI